MRLEWNEAKNRVNTRKHGYDFSNAEEMFRGLLIVDADTRKDYGENRWTGVGIVKGRVAQVIFVQDDHETIRIISRRKAPSRERKEFEKTIADRLESN